MKKMKLFKVALLMLAMCTSSVTNAQDLGSFLSGVVNTVTSSKATASSIVGTWKYNAPACQFESDNLLAKAGGVVASKKIETKMQSLCTKAGLSTTSSKYVFSNDGKYTCTVGKKVTSGTYTFNESSQTLNLVTTLGVKINAKVVVSGGKMRLLFKANKLMSLLKTISSTASKASTNSAMSAISTLSSQYDGMEVGFELTKQ